MPRFIPNWFLWLIVIAATIASPFVALLLLFLVGEVMWDAGNAIGLPATLTVCAAATCTLLFVKFRPRPAGPSPG